MAALVLPTLAPQKVSAANNFITDIPINGSPSGITAGPDGNMWFGDFFSASVSRITVGGAVTKFALPSGSCAQELTAGPDGNVWFTEQAQLCANVTDQVGYVTPAGQVTEFPLASRPLPEGITSGPDGNVWFTEPGHGQIAKITPSGSLTEYPINGGNDAAAYITAGPDGALWFTDTSTNSIGRITTAGVVTATYPTGHTSLGHITVGPDGNLWFTSGDGFIGRITTAGAITEFPAASPNAITSGPDGNVWFTERSGSNVGRITPTGVVTQFATGSFDGWGIASGPDGNVWLSQSRAGPGQIAVARLTATFPVVGDLGSAPHFSPPSGGTAVTVQGLNFSGATDVMFGTTPAISFTVDSATQITATSPPGPSFTTVDVTVTTPQGTSAVTPLDQFVYTPFVLYNVPTSASRPGHITKGPDGNVWFTSGTAFGASNGQNLISRTTPAGVTTEFHAPGNTAVDDIAAGADGNIWFTEPNASKVAKITPSGTISEYATPTPAAKPHGITLGPDGNMWFTEQAASKVASVTPTGAITEYKVSTSPGLIATGSDGNLWFATGVPGVARITTAGVETDFVFPPDNTPPNSPVGDVVDDITAGPDGNIWAIQGYIGNITEGHLARITPAGLITEFSLRTVFAGFGAGITTGSDGNIWVTQPTVNDIGKITPDGTVTEFPLPLAGANPVGITFGADGNPWFIAPEVAIRGTPSHAQVGTLPANSVGLGPTSMPSSTPVLVSAMDTHWGPSTGGKTVHISGVNLVGATSVTFGTVPAQSFTVVDADHITAVSPAEATGLVNITVTTPNGSNTSSSSSEFGVSDPACGAVITATTTLKKDIGPCGGDGVVIGADNITLNLAGHKVFGFTLRFDDTAGIRLPIRHGVTIENGSVSGFDAGIYVNSGGGNTITSMNIHDNIGPDGQPDFGDGIFIAHSASNQVLSNAINHNGIYDGIGVFGLDADFNVIKGNTITNGVSLQNGTGGDGVDLAAFLELGDPRRGNSIFGNVVANNTITGNQGTGLSTQSNVNGQYIGNDIERNGLDPNNYPDNGIGLSNDANATPNLNSLVQNNRVIGNGDDGIQANSSGIQILANTTGGNNVNGDGFFDLDDNNNDCQHNNWTGNTYGSGGVYPPCLVGTNTTGGAAKAGGTTAAPKTAPVEHQRGSKSVGNPGQAPASGGLALNVAPNTAQGSAGSAPTCGSVITANVTLTANIGPCNGPGLIAGASNITINLGGHQVSGAGAFSTSPGIDIEDYQGVTVENGAVTGFAAGVFINFGSNETVEKLNVHDNIGPSSVTNPIIDPHTGSIGLMTGGIIVFHSFGNQILTNTVNHNGVDSGIGIYGVDANANVVKANTVTNTVASGDGTLGGGIVVTATLEPNDDRRGLPIDGNDVLSNTVSGNQGVGILSVSDLGGLFKANTVSRNGVGVSGIPADGIQINFDAAGGASPGTGDNLLGNNVSGNGGNGIAVFSGGNTILGNSATGDNVNSSGSFDLFDSHPTCDRNTWQGNASGSAGFSPSCA